MKNVNLSVREYKNAGSDKNWAVVEGGLVSAWLPTQDLAESYVAYFKANPAGSFEDFCQLHNYKA